MIIDDVHRGIQKNKTRKRIGRGTGSGHGKTSGRGHKGAGSRNGYAARVGFQGGQMPLARTIAKRGFNNNFFAVKVRTVNVAALESLHLKGLAKGRFDVLKILGNGDLKKKLTVHAHQFSQSALEKIAAAGGTAEQI